MSMDTEIFGKKKFSDLLKDIYENQKKKDRQITALIADLKPLIGNLSDAAMLVPMITNCIEISVKNDDQLVKLAAIVQRIVSNHAEEGSSFLSDEEKESLLKGIREIEKTVEDIKVEDKHGSGSTEDNS